MRHVHIMLTLIFLASGATAATYTVHADGSGDFSNIQAAMYAAVTGDVIQLSDGVFTGPGNRDLDTNEITFSLVSISGDPELCVINCQGSSGDPHYGIAYSTQGPSAVLSGISIINAWFAPNGGALNLSNASIMVQNCRFISNVAQNFGGAVFGNDWSSPTFTDCLFRSNIAYNNKGGAVHIEDNSEPLFQGCTFGSNMASSGGALSFDLSCSVEVNDCTIEGSVANAIDLGSDGDLSIIQSIVAFNQGVAVTGAVGSVANAVCCDVYGNTAGDWVSLLGGQGGSAGNFEADPLFCNAGQGDYALHSTSPCAEANNPSCGQVGAWPVGCWNVITVAADGTGDFPTIQAAVDAAVSGVDAIELLDGVYTGTGNRDVYFLGKAITIRSQSGNPSDCIIDVNGSATSNHIGFYFWNDEGPESVLQGVTIQDGYSDNWGGAISIASASPTIMNCVFLRNAATTGGAIYAATYTELTISDCDFVENEVVSDSAYYVAGGAIYFAVGTLNTTNCRFIDNHSGPDDFITELAHGGAVYLDGVTEVHFDGCTFSGNTASHLGGTVLAYNTQMPLDFTSCTFYDNGAAEGSAIYVYGSSVAITSSILTAGRFGGAVVVENPNVDMITLSCSDVYGNVGGDWTGVIADQAYTNGNFSANPQFCDAAAGEFTLTASSPCAPLSSSNPSCGLIGAQPVGCAYDGVISTVSDVGNDQGRRVRVSWARSSQDNPGTPYTIESYSIWRRIDGFASAASTDDAAGDKAAARAMYFPTGDWDYVTSVPARSESAYNVICTTLGDSTIASGMFWSMFFVSAETNDPTVFFDSAPDSGYSLDNLAPSVPLNFRFELPTLLAWQESSAVDFDYFTVYGSFSSQLDPSAVRIGHTTGLSMELANPVFPSYLLTATDFAGNEGEAAVIGSTSDVPEAMPTVLRLYPNQPNPFNPKTTIRYDVPKDGRVTLRVYDVRGALVSTLVDTVMPRGSHQIDWDGRGASGRGMASGSYVARLEAGGTVRILRMTVVK